MRYNVVYRDENSKWKVRRTQYAGEVKLEAGNPQAAVDMFRKQYAKPGHVVTQVDMPSGATAHQAISYQEWVEVDDWE